MTAEPLDEYSKKETHDPERIQVSTDAAHIERLGRERPQCFKNLCTELSFCFSIVMSQILAVRIFHLLFFLSLSWSMLPEI